MAMTRRRVEMPKVLTEQQVRDFEEQGYLSPVRAMSAERAAEYRPALPPSRGDGAHLGGTAARARIRHAPARCGYPRPVQRRAAAGRRVHGNRARELEACGGLPGQAALRGQPLRAQRGIWRPAGRHMTPA